MQNKDLFLYINSTGKKIKTAGLTLNQNSTNNILHVVTVGKYESLLVNFKDTGGVVSSAYHMVLLGKYKLLPEDSEYPQLIENADSLYEYTLPIPYKVTSSFIPGSTARISASVAGYNYDMRTGILIQTTVANTQIILNKADTSDQLDEGYNQTDVENLWKSLGLTQIAVDEAIQNTEEIKLDNIQIKEDLRSAESDILDLQAKDIIHERDISSNKKAIDGLKNTDAMLSERINGKQDILVSGINIKTINNKSVLGEGNLELTADDINLSDYYKKNQVYSIQEINDKGFVDGMYVQGQISKLIGSAPGVLDTLDELAKALGDDPNFATTMTNQLALKADKTEIAELAVIAGDKEVKLNNQTNGVKFKTINGFDILGEGNIKIDPTNIDFSDYYNKSTINSLLAGKLNVGEAYTIPEANGRFATLTEVGLKADKTEIPLRTSQLTNDSGFLTQHQSLANYYTINEIDNQFNNFEKVIPTDIVAERNEIYLYHDSLKITGQDNPVRFKTINNQSILGLGNFDFSLANYYTKDETYSRKEVDDKISGVYTYKGTVPTKADLPKENNRLGDVWNVAESDINYAWDGATWDALGSSGSVDLSEYYKKVETYDQATINYKLGLKADAANTYDKATVDENINAAKFEALNKFKDYYTKNETNVEIVTKLADYYNKGTVDEKLTNNKLENKTYTDSAISKLVGNAPSQYDTLGEIATLAVQNQADIGDNKLAIARKAEADSVYTTQQTYNRDEINNKINNLNFSTVTIRDWSE